MKKLRSMKGSGTLIVTISAIVFLIYATSTFSDVKHLKYMQEKYEEDIKELYENDLKLIDLDATDELNIDYEIKLYNGSTVVKPAGKFVADPDRVKIYITLNVPNDEVAEIKYAEYYASYNATSAAEWFLERDTYNSEFFKDNGTSIKSTYNEDGQYIIEDTTGSSFIIYAKDNEGREKIIEVIDVFVNWIQIDLRWKRYYDYDIGVIATIDNECIYDVCQLEEDSNRVTFGGITKYVIYYYMSTGTTQMSSETSEYITIKPQEDEIGMVYKIYAQNISKTNSNGTALGKLDNAFVEYRPQFRVLNALKSMWITYDTTFLMDWSDVEYRDGYGYYSKSTGEYYGNGDYWHVFDYYADTGELKIVNKIVSTKEEI